MANYSYAGDKALQVAMSYLCDSLLYMHDRDPGWLVKAIAFMLLLIF